MKQFVPLLAGKVDLKTLEFPVIISPKLDGIRVLIRNGSAVTRKLKHIPNHHINSALSFDNFEGLDGEVIVGRPHGDSVFSRTSSGVMSHEGTPAFKFWVFDEFSYPKLPFYVRYERLQLRRKSWPSWVKKLSHHEIKDRNHLKQMHEFYVSQGYEGTIIRSPQGVYKFGRSTTKEGILLKMVDYETDEATIVDFKELQHNGNPAERDALGHTKRSTAKAGKSGRGVLGAFVVESEKYRDRFDVGTGFTDDARRRHWHNRKSLRGKIIRFKHKPFGQVDCPRHPVFQGFRNAIDT